MYMLYSMIIFGKWYYMGNFCMALMCRPRCCEILHLPMYGYSADTIATRVQLFVILVTKVTLLSCYKNYGHF